MSIESLSHLIALQCWEMAPWILQSKVLLFKAPKRLEKTKCQYAALREQSFIVESGDVLIYLFFKPVYKVFECSLLCFMVIFISLEIFIIIGFHG